MVPAWVLPACKVLPGANMDFKLGLQDECWGEVPFDPKPHMSRLEREVAMARWVGVRQLGMPLCSQPHYVGLPG